MRIKWFDTTSNGDTSIFWAFKDATSNKAPPLSINTGSSIAAILTYFIVPFRFNDDWLLSFSVKGNI
ncbi:MAG: hypothetical protein AT712_03090 [Caldivirga sp. CIS_19]|nr:MAG: hypothetical protein AT712_03090 [Caldivirga sp. CIS_19]